jgi:hypothetical protein
MKNYCLLALLLGFFLTSISSLAKQLDDCSCINETCNPCQEQTNIEFYTEKCGTTGRVKSCKKPTCVDLNPLPKSCQASTPKEDSSKLTRKPAQVEPSDSEAMGAQKSPVGTAVAIIGDVVVLRDKIENPLKLGQSVFSGDLVSVRDEGRAKIVLSDKSVISILSKSKTLVHYEGKPGQSKTLLELMYGSVRSTVTTNSDNKKHFEVKTPSATAGVRGTDFTTTYYESSKVTKVQTLEGAVELRANHADRKLLVPAGFFASYVVDQEHQEANASTSMKYVDSGFLTSLEKISPTQKDEILAKSHFPSSQMIAASRGQKNPDPICQTPSAKFNECAWSCVNNPKKASSCRIDLPQVSCVRKRCDANGVWSDDQRLPASSSDKCDTKPVVAPCDY